MQLFYGMCCALLALAVADKIQSQHDDHVSIHKDDKLREQWAQYVQHVMMEIKQQEGPDDERKMRSPDLLDKSPDYKPTLIGHVDATDPFPQLEGYKPPLGHFQQSEDCEALMRVWMDDCAFIDHPTSVYHKDPSKIWPTGQAQEDGTVPTKTYIGNYLHNANSQSPMVTSRLMNRGDATPSNAQELQQQQQQPP